MNINNNKDGWPGFWFIVSNALPPVRFFLYLRHGNQPPSPAEGSGKVLIGAPQVIIGGYFMNTYILN